jgi:hypothetical protein
MTNAPPTRTLGLWYPSPESYTLLKAVNSAKARLVKLWAGKMNFESLWTNPLILSVATRGSEVEGPTLGMQTEITSVI